MGIYDKERETKNTSIPIWGRRINKLLKETGLTQSELAEISGVPSATISGWISNEGNTRRIEPKVLGLKKVAIALGVSTDYLLGRHECKTPKSEEISRQTGLSDKSIQNLKELQKRIQKGNHESESKLAVCNFLIENIDDTPLLDNIYNYLFADYLFQTENSERTCPAFIISKTVSGERKKSIVFSTIVGQAYLVEVQHDLMRLKDRITKRKNLLEKEEYEKSKNKIDGSLQKEIWDEIDKIELNEEGNKE